MGTPHQHGALLAERRWAQSGRRRPGFRAVGEIVRDLYLGRPPFVDVAPLAAGRRERRELGIDLVAGVPSYRLALIASKSSFSSAVRISLSSSREMIPCSSSITA